MQLAIRQAIKTDADILQSFAVITYLKAFGDSMSKADVDALMQSALSIEKVKHYLTTDLILIAEQKGMLVGYVHLSDIKITVTTPTQTSKQLQRLYVHPDYQGHGIGSHLIEAAFKTDLLKNAKYVYLDVWEKNTGAIKLYQKYGFIKVDEKQFIHASGEKGDYDWIMCREQSAK